MVDYSYPLTEDELSLGVGWCQSEVTKELVVPHPDGQPWKKCCCNEDDTFGYKTGSPLCAYTDPDGNRVYLSTKSYPVYAQVMAEGGRFFCCHRTEDGYSRVCAGFHAKDGQDKKVA